MNSIKKRKQTSKFLDIFNEIFLHWIFRFLDIDTLVNVSISCKRLNMLFEYLFEKVFFLNPMKLDGLNNKINEFITTNDIKICEMYQPHIHDYIIDNYNYKNEDKKIKDLSFKSSTFYSYSYSYIMTDTYYKTWEAYEFMVFQDVKKDWYLYRCVHGGDGCVYYGEFFGGRGISIYKFKTFKDLLMLPAPPFRTRDMMIAYSKGSSDCIYIKDCSW